MNFIYIIPDELRSDAIGCNGNIVAKTPNIDKLANLGVNFTNCYVQYPVCSPSRCSFMTGWYPHVRGHRSLWHLLQNDEPNLLKYFKKNGYHVYWDGKHNDLLSQDSVANSIDEIHTSGISSFGRNPYNSNDPLSKTFLYSAYKKPLEAHEDHAKTTKVIDFLKTRKRGDRPFVCFLPYIYPHPPYCAPHPFHDLFSPEEVENIIPPCESKPSFHKQIRQIRHFDKLTPEIFRVIRARYHGMVSFIDFQVGRILNALEQTGLINDTVIFFFSDHGDYAGDYGLVEKWPSGMEDCLTKVPLIIKSPNCLEGHRVSTPVELMDIMATSLDLAGIEASHEHFSRSLVNELKGGKGDPNRIVFCEGGYSQNQKFCIEGSPFIKNTIHSYDKNNPLYQIYGVKCELQQKNPNTACRTVMARSNSHKLVLRTNGENEFYNLQEDPYELDNIFGKNQLATQNSMKESILLWLIETSDVTPWKEDKRIFELVDK